MIIREMYLFFMIIREMYLSLGKPCLYSQFSAICCKSLILTILVFEKTLSFPLISLCPYSVTEFMERLLL